MIDNKVSKRKKSVKFADDIQVKIIDDNQTPYFEPIKQDNYKDDKIEKLPSKNQLFRAILSNKLDLNAIPKFKKRNSSNPFTRRFDKFKEKLKQGKFYKFLEKVISYVGNDIDNFFSKYLPESQNGKYYRNAPDKKGDNVNLINFKNDQNIINQLVDNGADPEKFQQKINISAIYDPFLERGKSIAFTFEDKDGKKNQVLINVDKFYVDALEWNIKKGNDQIKLDSRAILYAKHKLEERGAKIHITDEERAQINSYKSRSMIGSNKIDLEERVREIVSKWSNERNEFNQKHSPNITPNTQPGNAQSFEINKNISEDVGEIIKSISNSSSSDRLVNKKLPKSILKKTSMTKEEVQI